MNLSDCLGQHFPRIIHALRFLTASLSSHRSIPVHTRISSIHLFLGVLSSSSPLRMPISSTSPDRPRSSRARRTSSSVVWLCNNDKPLLIYPIVLQYLLVRSPFCPCHPHHHHRHHHPDAHFAGGIDLLFHCLCLCSRFTPYR